MSILLSMAPSHTSIIPGRSLGPINLGASLHEVLTIIKESKDSYPKIALYFDPNDPLANPVVVSLPDNGFRLQFDGTDQRLRLIEVIDFTKAKVLYKTHELLKPSETGKGPSFRKVYQLFQASYPGEYHPPKNGGSTGDYALSWPGIAFTFPLQHSAWAPEKDHVAILGSAAASPATRMAIFEGSSWPEARKTLFTNIPTGPRMSEIARRPKDHLPAEVEMAVLYGEGRIQLQRRPPTAPVMITINETTPQDLVTELGPPDAMHKRDTLVIQQEQPGRNRNTSVSSPVSNGRARGGSQPASYSSTGTDTFDVDFDSGDADDDANERAGRETYWCYFSHGVDILVGPPTETSTLDLEAGRTPKTNSPRRVVTRIVIQGNVPGSYSFNRHRRIRWQLALPETEYAGDLTSENKFDHLQPSLIHIFQDVWPASEMGKGKVVNRTWANNSGESSFFLPDEDKDLDESGGSEQWLGNTRLYTFPGLVFEVLENGAVSALTIC